MLHLSTPTVSIQIQRNLLHREFWIQLVVGRLLPTIIPLLIWQSLFDYNHVQQFQEWGSADIIAYYLLVSIISLFGDIHFHYDMSDMVHMGTLNQWLIRPLSFLETALSYVIAKIMILLLPGIALILVGLFLIPNTLSTISASTLLSVLTVVPLAVVMFASLSITIGMLSFWIIRTDSTFALIMLLLEFLGGRLLPISFLPAWLQTISNVFPLQYAIYLPVEIILHPGEGSVFAILLGQGLWRLLLLLLGTLLWQLGIRRYDAGGG
ncbi:MAG: ABC-2 family transporter protein [Candidatus Peribacteraceae bacterium]|nr:ABC-2 family transporter protein [Candidatus Peribacteraceae bacterium]